MYKALSAVEHEELQLNDEYKTELRAEDVDRILELPREIQLALPHLKSASEVEAHKLLTTYTLEYGEAEFAKADKQSQDHMFFAPSEEVRSAGCSLRIVLLPPECMARIALVASRFRQHKRQPSRGYWEFYSQFIGTSTGTTNTSFFKAPVDSLGTYSRYIFFLRWW